MSENGGAPRPALGFLRAELEELAARGLLRSPRVVGGDKIDLCSNDYLGFSAEPGSGQSLPGGAGASRLVSGNRVVHEEAERSAAAWVNLEAALLFSSGYAANVGALSALIGPEDRVVSDALNHASIIDGLRLSRAEVRVVPHLDVGAVASALADGGARRRWVVTESIYSMDGDEPDLVRLRAICDAVGAGLIVDEAHALGVRGPEGGGLCRDLGVVPDVLVGTLGKAVGLQGAFVAGSTDLIAWLWNRARSFVFSTGVSPAIAGSVAPRIAEVRAADDRRAALRAHCLRVRSALAELGSSPPAGPVFPWVLGSAPRAVSVAEELWSQGVHIQAIRPPTVPEGTARLRLTVRSSLPAADLDRALSVLRSVARGAG